MQQTLFFIPAECYGWPVFGFGLLLAAWLTACAVVVIALARRQGFNAETQSYLPLMLLVAAVIVLVLPLLCEPRGLPIRGYGMMILLAVLSALGLAGWRARRCGVNPETIFTLAFWMVLPGILGARAVYVAEYWFKEYWPAFQSAKTFESGVRALLFQVCNVANGGLVVYGCFIGGAIGIFMFRRKHRVPLLATMDLVAPSVLLGVAIGRVGCLLNGCCYGSHCDLPWGVTFPWNSPVYMHQIDAGEIDPLGIKLKSGPNHQPIVSAIAADSPAAHSGLKAGDELLEINGMPVNSVEDARWAMLQIDKLYFAVERGDGSIFSWRVDDPSGETSRGFRDASMIQIYGLTLSGRDSDRPIIASVVSHTPEAAAGFAAGQRIVAVSGKSVDTFGELDKLLSQHRKAAWLHLLLSGGRPPIDVDVARPLPRSLVVHPTQVYSTIDALVLCLLLLAYDNFRRRDGELAALTMTIYPIARFLVEAIRTDEPPIWYTPFTISQNISIVILLIAISLWVYILRRPPEMAFVRRAEVSC